MVNIIRDFQNGVVDPSCFECAEERNLHEAFLKIRQNVIRHIADGEYQVALIALAQLRTPVDAFFEAVLVMAEEEKIRFNRLSLLLEISHPLPRCGGFFQDRDGSVGPKEEIDGWDQKQRADGT